MEIPSYENSEMRLHVVLSGIGFLMSGVRQKDLHSDQIRTMASFPERRMEVLSGHLPWLSGWKPISTQG